jgi:ABC-2 type transport system permease protein
VIVKEWQEARWKFVVGTILFLALVAANLPPYRFILMNIEIPPPPMMPDDSSPPLWEQVSDPLEWAITNLWFSYAAGKSVLALLAVVLGIGFVSGEVSRGTIFLLLSKPLGRVRVFLVKYLVGALVLLAVAALGSIGLIVVENIYGWPVGSLSALGVSLSTLLMWLGGLFIFGVALLASVAFGDAIRSTSVALLAGLLTFRIPVATGDDGLNPLPQTLALPDFWHDPTLFAGEKLVPASFLICAIAAVVPFFAAL